MSSFPLTEYAPHFLVGFVSVYLLYRALRTNRPPPPPGPKPWPVIGNVLDIPSAYEWLTFAEWGKKYGGICSVTAFGQTVVVVNSAKIAMDLLDKRSSIYSDRPVLQMGGELVGWKDTLVLLPYGDRFRRVRKLFHRTIGSVGTMKQFHHLQSSETHRFLRRVLSKPDDLAAHIRKTAGAIILRISHGYEVKETNDPFVDLADTAVEQFSLATAPGGFLVDVMPILKYVPDWFPGAHFKRQAKVWAAKLQELVDRPHSYVKQQMAAGTAPVSFTSSLLDTKPSPDEEFEMKWASASLYGGGADTIVSSVYAFFLAMTLNPEVAKKAQAELDSVVGNDRLPDFSDRPNLPYIEALVKEVLRWNSVTPDAFPHRLSQDDVYEGYFIPKGSVILCNTWHMTHDPQTYPDPFTFNPDRFIATENHKPEPDPRQFAFGFGRRICPGMHLADSSLFLSCAMSLAVFDISKCVENGVIVEPVNEHTNGTISHPKPFKCAIRPRSEHALALVLTE